MKRAGQLLEKIADPENLRLAFLKAKRGKNGSIQVLAYQENLENNLNALRQQILRGRAEVGNYYYFTIFEPKERKICASAFSEQVLHHALMNICDPIFEKYQIFDSYASRVGKGSHAAIKKAQSLSQRFPWFLKLDVKKFFDSVHHDALKGQLGLRFKDKIVTGLFFQIIDSYSTSPGRGLPIGNLTSQYFANHFLAGLDHFIKENLKVRGYVRYMDDMVLWQEDKDCLKDIREAVRSFIESHLHCSLKPETLNHVNKGLPFLGFRVYPGRIGLTQRSKQRFIRKMNFIEERYQSGDWEEVLCERRTRPLIAFIQQADSHSFREKVLNYEKGLSS